MWWELRLGDTAHLRLSEVTIHWLVQLPRSHLLVSSYCLLPHSPHTLPLAADSTPPGTPPAGAPTPLVGVRSPCGTGPVQLRSPPHYHWGSTRLQQQQGGVQGTYSSSSSSSSRRVTSVSGGSVYQCTAMYRQCRQQPLEAGSLHV